MHAYALHVALGALLLVAGCSDRDERYPAEASVAADAMDDATEGGVDGPMEGGAEGGSRTDGGGVPVEAGPWAFDAGPVQPICDGGAELRFAARVVGGNSSRPDMMTTHVGMSYVYVRGDCSFWSNWNVAGYAPTYSGTLTPAEEQEFSRDFYYGYWASLADYYPGNDTSHTSLQLYDATRVIGCAETACEVYGADMDRPIVGALRPAYSKWLKKLETIGQAYRGDVRATARVFNDEAAVIDAEMRMFLIKWSQPWALDDLVGDFAGAGVVVSGARADDLHTLRTMYTHDGAVVVPGSSVRMGAFYLQMEGKRVMHELWLRDALPIEDARGVIALGDAGR